MRPRDFQVFWRPPKTHLVFLTIKIDNLSPLTKALQPTHLKPIFHDCHEHAESKQALREKVQYQVGSVLT